MRAFAWLTLTLTACGAGDIPSLHGDPTGDAVGDAFRLGDDAGDGDPSGDSAGGDPDSTCGLAGVAGACSDAGTCSGASYLELCGGPPSLQCCLAGETACSDSGAPGACIDTADCPTGWQSTAGLCPGAATIQCCTEIGVACDEAATPLPNEGLVEEDWGAALCPHGMIRVSTFCIDRFEASLVRLDGGGNVVSSWSPFVNPGTERVRAVSIGAAVPQGYINGDQAAAACNEAGKRLCTDEEWLRACQGTTGSTYPYSNTREPGWCNDARTRHPAVEYFGTSDAWIWSELGNSCINQIPDSVHVTGQHPACVTQDGALDMMGNLHEWTANTDGIFRGGFYADTTINGEGCLYATTAHNRLHWDYSTGFRCCADPP